MPPALPKIRTLDGDAVKIALVSETFYPHVGGITEHVHHLARFLGSVGNEVRIVTGYKPDPSSDSQEAEGYRVVYVGHGLPVLSNGGLARITVGVDLLPQMERALRGVDVVNVHSPLFPTLAYLAIKAARDADVPIVGTFHTDFKSTLLRLFRPGVRAYGRALDRAIAVSANAARCVAEYVEVPTTIIPNGVDGATWGTAPPRPELQNQRNLVYLGRLDPRNDIEVVLAAFAQVAAYRADIRLILVGGGTDLSAYSSLVPEALRGRVIFTGTVSKVAERARYLASAELLLFTACRATSPMALLEGLAAGLPVLSYDIEGVRDVLSREEAGILVPTGDAAALATAALSLLADEPRRARMAASARVIAASYDWTQIGVRIETVLQQAVQNRGKLGGG